MQSGTSLNNWSWGKNNSAEIAKCLGYKETDEKKILEKLMKESPKNLISAQRKIKEVIKMFYIVFKQSSNLCFLLQTFAASKIRPWGPVVEPPSADAILTEHPTKIMHAQGGHKIPIIIGYNSGEGVFFELVRKTVPGISLPLDLEHEIPYELDLETGGDKSKEIADKLKKAYFGDNHSNEEDIDMVYKVSGCFKV